MTFLSNHSLCLFFVWFFVCFAMCMLSCDCSALCAAHENLNTKAGTIALSMDATRPSLLTFCFVCFLHAICVLCKTNGAARLSCLVAQHGGAAGPHGVPLIPPCLRIGPPLEWLLAHLGWPHPCCPAQANWSVPLPLPRRCGAPRFSPPLPCGCVSSSINRTGTMQENSNSVTQGRAHFSAVRSSAHCSTVSPHAASSADVARAHSLHGHCGPLHVSPFRRHHLAHTLLLCRSSPFLCCAHPQSDDSTTVPRCTCPNE